MISKSAALALTAAILVGSCLTTALTLGAEASSPPVPTASTLDPGANAALDWWRAFDALPASSEPAMKFAESLSGQLPDPAVDALFNKPVGSTDVWTLGANHSIDLFTLGANHSYCDWGVDLATEGATAALPYIGKIRPMFRLVLLRARWHAARGESVKATDDLLVCLHAARLFPGRRPALLDLFIGISCESMTINAIAAIAPQLRADQRQRIAAALPALPPRSMATEALSAEVEMVTYEINRLLTLPLGERMTTFALLTYQPTERIDQDQRATMLSDPSLTAGREAFLVEVARWQAHLRQSLAEQLKPLDPVIPGDEQPLIQMLTEAIQGFVPAEVRLIVLRAQLAAALDCLEHGDDALLSHSNPVDGAPFRQEKEVEGFRLSTLIPELKGIVKLAVGLPPRAPATTGEAPVPQDATASTPDANF